MAKTTVKSVRLTDAELERAQAVAPLILTADNETALHYAIFLSGLELLEALAMGVGHPLSPHAPTGDIRLRLRTQFLQLLPLLAAGQDGTLFGQLLASGAAVAGNEPQNAAEDEWLQGGDDVRGLGGDLL